MIFGARRFDEGLQPPNPDVHANESKISSFNTICALLPCLPEVRVSE
jgi:hypothetical protein